MLRLFSLTTALCLLFAQTISAKEPWILHGTRSMDPDRVSVAKLAATFKTKPVAVAFAFVRDQIRYEPYRGQLRGAYGTLLARAGNGLDQSLLLAALLKSGGHKVRFARGQLTGQDAAALIVNTLDLTGAGTGAKGSAKVEADLAALESEINAHYTSIMKVLKGGAVNLRPAAGEDLSGTIRDHWWLEVRVDGRWISLDPSFPSAKAGEARAKLIRTVSSIPAAMRHRVSVRVMLEEQARGKSSTRALLRFKADSADLSGRSVVLSHQSASWRRPASNLGEQLAATLAGIGASNDPRVRPVLTVGERAIRGTAFNPEEAQKPSRSSGIGIGGLGGGGGAKKSKTAVSEWVEITFHTPGGASTTSVYPVFDRVGFAPRRAGSEKPAKGGLGRNHPKLALICMTFFTGTVSDPAIMDAESGSSAGSANGKGPTGINVSNFLADLSTAVASVADRLLWPMSVGDDTVVFAATSPRLVIATLWSDPGKAMGTLSIDLRRSGYVPVASSKDLSAENFRLQVLKGVADTVVESFVLRNLSPGVVGATADQSGAAPIFMQAAMKGIEPILLNSAALAVLKMAAGVTDEAAARLATELDGGKLIIAPGKPVNVGDSRRIAWWRIDQSTGRTIGVTQQGLHGESTEYTVVTQGVFAEKRVVMIRMYDPVQRATYSVPNRYFRMDYVNFLLRSGRKVKIYALY